MSRQPSRQGSTTSIGSRKSTGRYRSLGHGGADDSLFGKNGSQSHSSVKQISLSKISESKKHAPVETDSIVITNSDLDRLRKLATVIDRDEMEKKLQEEREQRLREQAKARERKEKMLAMEATRRATMPKGDLEVEDEMKNTLLLESAQNATDEERDVVKHMNQMMLYAKCVTIRDAQLLEKRKIQKEHAEQEKQFDQLMEEERLRAIELQEEQEKRKIEERKRGASIIRMQIEQREKDRIREQEQLDMEREAMLRQIEKMKQEEQQKEEGRRQLGQQLLEEAALANKTQIQRKQEQRMKAIEEDQRIAEYLAEKDRKEQEWQEQLEKEAKRKAEETARLRAMQEKMADKQAEEDALRAKRAQEDYERAWRAKEKAERERKEMMLKEIMESREEQKRTKERVQAEAAQAQKHQFEQILAVQKAAEHAELEKERLERQKRLEHNEFIRKQIAEIEEKKQRNRQEFLEEGSKIRIAKEIESRRLESIKQKKIMELRNSGVPEKYLAELTQKKLA
eukprot:755234-Hanusia_phi.AAC.3